MAPAGGRPGGRAERERGFTLLELLVVLTALGLLAAVALPRSYALDTSLGAAARRMQADIRYAQELAMTRGTRHRVRFYASTNPSPTNRYEIVTAAGASVVDPHSGSAAYVVDFSAGAFPGVRLDSTLTVEFDALGRPDGAKTIVLNGGARVISVSAETGLVTP